MWRLLTFLRKKFFCDACRPKFFCTFRLKCNLGKTTTGSVETHRGWRRLASFARSTGDTREHAPTALTALPEEVRGGSDLRRRGAARVLSRLCVGSHAMLTCRCIRARARSTLGLGGSIGGRAACGACCMERDADRRDDERSTTAAYGQSARRASRSDESDTFSGPGHSFEFSSSPPPEHAS